jgi:hypothetical protein
VVEVYRLKSPTLGLHTTHGQLIHLLAPQGSLVFVEGPLDQGTKLIECRCAGIPMMLFTIDILEHGLRVLAAGHE